MLTQTFIEIEYGSTYTFTYFKEVKNTSVIPSAAKISIYGSDNSIIIENQDMTIDGSTGVCTYDWDSAGYSVGRNYSVKYILDGGNPVVRFFDIYLYPFINDVTDDDLFNVNKSIRDDTWGKAGAAESGTTSTLVDSVLSGYDDGYWTGGIITIYQGDRIEERKITNFVKSTGTITFSPLLSTAVNTNTYEIRKSYQDKILLAGEMVQNDFRRQNKRAYLLIDHYQVKWLIIYKFFEEYFGDLIKEEGDEYEKQSIRYGNKYRSDMETMTMVYDENEDGAASEDEQDIRPLAPRWER